MLSIQCDVIIDGARPVSLLVMTVSPAWQSYVRWGALTGRGTFWRTYIIMPKGACTQCYLQEAAHGMQPFTAITAAAYFMLLFTLDGR